MLLELSDAEPALYRHYTDLNLAETAPSRPNHLGPFYNNCCAPRFDLDGVRHLILGWLDYAHSVVHLLYSLSRLCTDPFAVDAHNERAHYGITPLPL
jgi:hypothetical protein